MDFVSETIWVQQRSNPRYYSDIFHLYMFSQKKLHLLLVVTKKERKKERKCHCSHPFIHIYICIHIYIYNLIISIIIPHLSLSVCLSHIYTNNIYIFVHSQDTAPTFPLKVKAVICFLLKETNFAQ